MASAVKRPIKVEPEATETSVGGGEHPWKALMFKRVPSKPRKVSKRSVRLQKQVIETQAKRGPFLAKEPIQRLVKAIYNELYQGSTEKPQKMRMNAGALRLLRASLENYIISTFVAGGILKDSKNLESLMSVDYLVANLLACNKRHVFEIFPSNELPQFQVIDGLQATNAELNELETQENKEALKLKKQVKTEENAEKKRQRELKKIEKEEKKQEKLQRRAEKERKKQAKQESAAKTPKKAKRSEEPATQPAAKKAKLKQAIPASLDEQFA